MGVLTLALAMVALSGCAGDDSASPADAASPAGADASAAATTDATVTTLRVSDSEAAGKCMVLSADLLAGQEIAFDGEVTSVADGVATFEVSRWYAGEDTDVAEVEAPESDLTALLGIVEFEEGQRYLVAGREGGVAPCGMTAPYSEDLAAMYAEAFGS